jgi:Protein of unknown function (DUF2891)
MKRIGSLLLFLGLLLDGKCQQLTLEQAEHLIALPLKCAQQEFPNKLGQVLNSNEEIQSPSALHPAFYGCFDWHSSVHGHWLMVRLLKEFPTIQQASAARIILTQQLSAKNIQQEIAFFSTKYNESFERTYGWAWILQLQLELDNWNDELAIECANNLRPLSQLIVEKYKTFLPKLVYPIRSGEHINTAFGLTFAYDYGLQIKDTALTNLITKRALDFYGNDKSYPINYEPSGYDFLSGAFEEIDIMRRVMQPVAFKKWLKGFMPQIYKSSFKLEPGKVLDRTDGKLVHLDGLNFSRAWCLFSLAKQDSQLAHLSVLADNHIQTSLPKIVDGDYMGEHWLASFAVYALMMDTKKGAK